MKEAARVVGKVEYREGDGPMVEIRHGPVEVEASPLDVTISWEDGDTRGSTAIPVSEYKRFLAEGAIQVEK